MTGLEPRRTGYIDASLARFEFTGWESGTAEVYVTRGDGTGGCVLLSPEAVQELAAAATATAGTTPEPAAMEPTPHDQLVKGQRIHVEYDAVVDAPPMGDYPVAARYELPDGDGGYCSIPPQATVTVLPDPEPEPERLTGTTELHNGMLARTPDDVLWSYCADPDVWAYGNATVGTRRLIRANAVIVR